MNDVYKLSQDRVQDLMKRQDEFLKNISGGMLTWSSKYLLPEIHKNDIFFPCVQIENLDLSLDNLKDLPDFDSSIFAKWRTADMPMIFVAGVLGALSSRFLRSYFDSLHTAWGQANALKGGHAGEGIDWAAEYDRPGGFGHRTLFGHDLFNPFEIDWSEYMDKAAQSGTRLPHWLKAGLYWLRHLLQDTFSNEGLPLPGHSYIRDALNPKSNHELIKYFGTIKMRDIAGSGVTNLIMGGYIWGTEHDFKRVILTPNYRGFSLMLGANFINLASGLLMPPPFTTLNWSTLPIMGYYLFRLIKMELKIGKELKKRDIILAENEATLIANMKKVAGNEIKLNTMLEELFAYDQQVCKYYNITNEYQEKLAQRIFNGKIE